MAVDLTPAAYFTRTGVSGNNQTQGGWFRLDAVPTSFNSMFALDNGAPDWMGIYIDNDGGSARLNFWENSASPVISGPLITLGEWYYVSVVRSGSTWTMYWRHEDDSSLTDEGNGSVTGTVGTALSLGKESVVDSATSFNGKMAQWRVHTSSLSSTDILAESNADKAVTAAWADWPMNMAGDDVSGNGRTATPSGTMVTFVGPTVGGSPSRPVPEQLTSGQSTTDGLVFTTASVTPASGSLVVVDVVCSRGTTVSNPSLGGSSISSSSVVTSVEVGSFHRGIRFQATGTGSAGAITITFTGANMTGCAWAVTEYKGANQVVQSQTGSGTGTAASTSSLGAFSARPLTAAVWGSAVNAAITQESGWFELSDAGYGTPATRRETSWTYAGDTTPTATVSSGSWLGIASEIATVSGDGTATPAAIAVGVTVPQAPVGAGAGPSSLVATGTLPGAAATGAGTVVPGAIGAVATVSTSVPSAGSSVSPTAIATAASLPTAAASSPAAVSPPAIDAVASLPVVSAIGAGQADPSAIAAPVTVPAPAPSAGSSTSPLAVPAAASLPAAAVTGGLPMSPAAIAATTSIPQASATGGDVTAPAPITASIAVPAPSVSAGSTVSPAASAVAATLPAPSATGAAQAIPATIPASVTLPLAAISAGATVIAEPIAAAVSVLAASIAAGVGPSTISTTTSLPAPVLSAASTVTPAAIVLLALLPRPDTVSDIEAVAVIGTYREPAINGYRETAARAWREP
jgi:hypothetical protein